MVFKKRKANEAELSTAPVPKRGRGRPANTDSATPASLSPPKHKSSHNALRVQPTATSSRPKRNVSAAKEIPKLARSSKSGGVSKPVPKPTRATVKTAKAATPAAKPKKASEKAKISKAGKNNSASTLAVKPKKSPKQANTSRKLTQTPLKNRRDSNVSVEIPHIYTTTADHVDGAEDEDPEGPSYWLMKAEPESRIEKGKDVKFSIDDLRNTTEPEAWDGVRNASARNNMRAMLKGDLAFFYHSNCKVPGIVGIMEVVEEHSVDESAFDPAHPYYDQKSTRENPKWCCVKVEYRQKFAEIIKLKELQGFAKDGGILANMQTLRMSRLSVSKVTKKEWDFILGLVDIDDDATPAAL